MLQKNFEFTLTKVNNNKIREKWTKLSFKTVYYREILFTLLIFLKYDLTNVTLGGQLPPLELVLEVVPNEAVVVLGGPAVVHDGGDGEVGHLQSFFLFKRVLDWRPEQRESKMTVLTIMILIS